MFQENSSRPSASNEKNSARHILLVEDNDADVMLAEMIHSETGHCSHLDVVHDGDEAISYLRREGRYSDRTRPDVVLLDVALPMRSGLEMITQIRAVPGCEIIPIVMVSGSVNPLTLKQAYELGANCVITKPSRLDEYFQKLETCYKFWCGTVSLPPSTSAPARK